MCVRACFQDRFTQGFREPPADRQQDYTLTDFAESDGRTILKFHRKRDTKDDRDIEIKVQIIFDLF